MAIGDLIKEEIRDLGERFVGAFVKRISDVPEYTVMGEVCDSAESALELSLKRCARIKVAPENVNEQESLLRISIIEALRKLS